LNAWHLITGEYPPQPGGVSDYTRLVAIELARAGDEVSVWAPACDFADPIDKGVDVHRLPGHFGPRAIALLDRELNCNPGKILVQYVPHAFGFKAMNFPFALWLYARRRKNITVMFHEVAYPRVASQPLKHNLLGAATRNMAAIVARAASRIFISTSSWEPQLRAISRNRKPIVSLPVPSNLSVFGDCRQVLSIRQRHFSTDSLVVGHFGTYGDGIAELLNGILPKILLNVPRASALLIGRNSEGYRDKLIRKNPDLDRRVAATGALSERDASSHISACDLMLQPYPDGISTRRTSAMVGLAHGRAIATTTGHLTESLWAKSGAVAISPVNELSENAGMVSSLLLDDKHRKQLGSAGRALYLSTFDISNTVTALRGAKCESQS
jgi:glycosyltransferase involved in cell wall biosynthesis